MRSFLKGSLLFILILFMDQSMLFGAQEENRGYFLSLEQKWQLISLGRIQDDKEIWYDVWICPGYVSPARYAKKYFFETGSDFNEYFQAKKYNDLARNSKDAYRWAFDDCINEFILKGIPKTWSSNFQAAANRTEKRVFGWWFAYPWALMEATVESAVRIPLGLTGMVLGTTWATAVVPTYHMTNSSVKGLWHLTVQTITIPIVGGTWNTIISPPLSLIGQKPSLKRVDGFWVKALTSEQVFRADSLDSAISLEDMALLKQWGKILDSELQPYKKEHEQAQQEVSIATKKIQDDYREKERGIRERESQHVDTLRIDPNKQEILNKLTESGYTADRLRVSRDQIRKKLQESGSVDMREIDNFMQLITKYPPAQGESNRIKKTDPLKRSVEIIKDIDSPHGKSKLQLSP